MDYTYIITAISFGLLFLILDLVLFYFRRMEYHHAYFSIFIKRQMERLAVLINGFPKPFKNRKSQQLSTPPILEPSAQITPENNYPPLSESGSLAHEDKSSSNIVTISQELIPSAEVEHGKNPAIRIQINAEVPEDTVLQINLSVEGSRGKASLRQQNYSYVLSHNGEQNFNSRLRNWVNERASLLKFKFSNPGKYFFLAAILIYVVVVSTGIDRYPIYFFTDEAAHMNLASDFIRDGLENYFGEFLPTFFTVEGWVNGTSVYVQVLPLLLFGKSVIVTRLVSAAISLLGAIAVSLLIRDILKLKYYWAGIFMVLTTPAWFLHARTAFEYVEVASFYSIFLYFYSRYRAGYLRSLYWAIIAAALTFYTHGLGQILIGVSFLSFFIVDFGYHTHPDRRKTVVNALLLGVIVLLPFARYYLAHPTEAAEQVKRRGSYWVDDSLSFIQKIGEFIKQYAYGLNPAYWYFKNPVDLDRHTMAGYGNGLKLTLPLMAIGLFQTLKNIRIPSYRNILISFLICPIPASVVAIGMPRMIWMTIPVALLTVIGISSTLEWAKAFWPSYSRWFPTAFFVLLIGLSFYMLRDALVNGPTWFQDYSLYGMQYGSRQVFQDIVRTGLEQDSQRRYVVSPSWANGTEQFIDFFIPAALRSRVSLGQPIDNIDEIRKKPQDLYFVTTADEFDKLDSSGKFKDITIHQVLSYPNGDPGFYVVTMNVVDNIDQILQAEHTKNRQPVQSSIPYNGQLLQVIHSPLGSGRVEDVFDNNPDTLARVLEANPFVFDLYPEVPINTNEILIQTGSLRKFTINISLYAPGTAEPVTYMKTFENQPPDPLVMIIFDRGPKTSSRIYIAITDNISGDSSQIHVREIEFK